MAKCEMKVMKNKGLAANAEAGTARGDVARPLFPQFTAFASALEGGLRLSCP
jgi:hypothetical protein